MPPVVQPPPPPDRPPAEPSPPESPAAGTPPAEPAAPNAQPAGRADPPLQQRSIAALFLALLSLLGVLGLSNFQRGVYIVAFALVAGAMAVWLAATAMRRARRRGTAGPRGSVVAIVIGGVGVLISAVLLAGFALFGKQASTYSQCLSGANTVAAQQTCRTQFTHAIEDATH
jgi:predicted PurR-regulated permease PerM